MVPRPRGRAAAGRSITARFGRGRATTTGCWPPSVSAATRASRLPGGTRPAAWAVRWDQPGADPFAIARFTIRNRRIVEMDIIADPEDLNRFDLEVLD